VNSAEDFEPEWSPRGKWIAYHSHRAPRPIPYYGASGSTDDVWLRRVGSPPRDLGDIRLTDFGSETGPPSWSRDGTRLTFVSYDRNGEPGVNLLWAVTIDTVTGNQLVIRACRREAEFPQLAAGSSPSYLRAFHFH